MKIIVQIPCLNEEENLELLLTRIKNFKLPHEVRTLLIDDGSTDSSTKIAHKLCDYIICHNRPRGLAVSFHEGLERAIEEGADIIVQIDADLHYAPENIPDLILPLLESKADVVLGCRNLKNFKGMGFVKKLLQSLGSRIISMLLGQAIPDCVTGFRAYTTRAARGLRPQVRFTYTLNTLFQSRILGHRIQFRQYEALPVKRKSRLARNSAVYLGKQFWALIQSLYLNRYPLFRKSRKAKQVVANVSA